MAKVRSEHYITIQEFMVNDLELSGNELIAYALIYGFSQDEESYFKGSLSYVARWLNCSKTTACTILNKLADDGFLEKKEKNINGVRLCDYTAYPIDEKILQEIKERKRERKEKEKAERYAKKLNTSLKNNNTHSKNDNVRSKNFNGGVQKTLTHNSIDILNDIKDENIDENIENNTPTGLNTPLSEESRADVRPKKPDSFKWVVVKQHIISAMDKLGYGSNAIETENAIETFRYYYMKYRDKTRQNHPRLNDKTMLSVLNRFINGTEQVIDTDADTYMALIDEHFKTNYGQDIDWNIQHFMAEDVRNILYHRVK